MKSAALGFRAHSGWTAVVALAVTKGVPSVLARQRVHLVETFTYRFRQPYHTAEKMPLEEAQAFISRIETEAAALAERAIRALQESLLAQGYALKRSGVVLASGRTLPPLPQILASHALIHTADGELFRRAILQASGRNGLASATAKGRELLSEASRVLRVKPGVLTRRIAEPRPPAGSSVVAGRKARVTGRVARACFPVFISHPLHQARRRDAFLASLRFRYHRRRLEESVTRTLSKCFAQTARRNTGTASRSARIAARTRHAPSRSGRSFQSSCSCRRARTSLDGNRRGAGGRTSKARWIPQKFLITSARGIAAPCPDCRSRSTRFLFMRAITKRRTRRSKTSSAALKQPGRR